MTKGKYVVIDGVDGTGKGTQIGFLKQVFPNAIFTREPGGSPLAEQIRKIVVDDDAAENLSPLTKLLLLSAARSDLQEVTVVPALNVGKLVVSDRGASSTIGYQLHGEQAPELMQCFDAIHKEIFSGRGFRGSRHPRPDLYIILDLPAVEARARVTRDHGRRQTFFDAKELDFYERVRDGFMKFASWATANGSRVEFIQAHGTPERVHRLIMMTLENSGIVP